MSSDWVTAIWVSGAARVAGIKLALDVFFNIFKEIPTTGNGSEDDRAIYCHKS